VRAQRTCLLADAARFTLRTHQVPLALKSAVDDVSQGRVPYNSVLCYGFFRFLTDSSKECRDCLFNYSSTYASRKISLRVFNHVQSLSLRFHLNRKTGAVLRAVSRGSAAYADLLRYFTFQIAPIFLEVGLVSAYLFSRYSPAFGLITITVMTVYVASTIIITEWRNKYRRLATEADDAFNQKAVDSLLNFETVLYFCAQEHISDVYDERHDGASVTLLRSCLVTLA
jgi:ABC-type transport system involved in Fe-S cluster assembly fused permease/ATPase subunit